MMKKTIAMLMLAGFSLALRGESSARSAPIALALPEALVAPIPVGTSVAVDAGVGWSDADGDRCRVTRNGVVLYSSADGGRTDVVFDATGVYELEHEISAAGTVRSLVSVRYFVTDETDWRPDPAAGADAMRSGALGPAPEGERASSAMSASVRGEGTVSFLWSVSCEESHNGRWYDYAAFAVDGAEVARIAGAVDRTNVTYAVSGAGAHALAWTFVRDDADGPEAAWSNAAWVAEFRFEPTPVTVAFDGNGATSGEPPASVVKYEGYSLALPGAGSLRNGLSDFEGWSDGVTSYAPGETFAFGPSDVTLSAAWSVRETTLADCLGATDLVFETGGDAAWEPDFATNRDGVAALRSGAIGHSQSTWLRTELTGPGLLTFAAKISGEVEPPRFYDYLKVELDGKTVFRNGDTDWTNVTVAVTNDGAHVVTWTYLKDDVMNVGFDCAWLDDVVWTPIDPDSVVVPASVTGDRDIVIGPGWAQAFPSFAASFGDDFPAAVLGPSGKTAAGGRAMSVWEDFVAGTDPTDPASRFVAHIRMDASGAPVVTWSPDLSGADGALKRVYRIWGKSHLDSDAWVEVDSADSGALQFFKVTVHMP